ncbi:MAG: hypothetical protein ACFBSC_14655 [Microcoleaceae cyanobacterium]
MNEQTIQLNFTIADPNLDDSERDQQARQLLKELRQLDEVERADRTEDLDSEAGGRPGLATLIGFLTIEVNRENIHKLLKWLQGRVSPKPIEIVVKDEDKDVKIVVQSSDDLEKAEQTVLNILGKMQE